MRTPAKEDKWSGVYYWRALKSVWASVFGKSEYTAAGFNLYRVRVPGKVFKQLHVRAKAGKIAASTFVVFKERPWTLISTFLLHTKNKDSSDFLLYFAELLIWPIRPFENH